MAREAVWLKIMPRAMADGLTGGRSIEDSKLAHPRDQIVGGKEWMVMEERGQFKL